MDTVKINGKKVKMIAHRGVSGLETENTAAAFVAAGNRSYFGIETDVHKTTDGQFVIFHDDNALRVSGIDKVIELSSYEELKEITLKDKDGAVGRLDLKMPLLKDYINICKKYDKVAVLELKNKFTEKEVGQITEIISDLSYLQKTVFISFDMDNLIFVRKYSIKQTVQFLTDKDPSEFIELLKAKKMDIDIYYERLTPENIKALHKAGIKINCWTCDDKAAAEKLIKLGVDFITSNILE